MFKSQNTNHLTLVKVISLLENILPILLHLLGRCIIALSRFKTTKKLEIKFNWMFKERFLKLTTTNHIH